MTRGSVFGWLAVLAVVDVLIPLPLLAGTLLFVAWKRPPWFLEMVRAVYGPDA